MLIARAKELVKSYPQGDGVRTVLAGVDIELLRGELNVILGPSGSGKTTLLNLLGLLDHPTSGSLELFGRDAATLREDERAEQRNRLIGCVFQFDSLLPEFTVLENVAMPALIRDGASRSARRAAEDRARGLLSRFGLDGIAARFPQALSGGERQRAAVARALINSPELLLADEPTGNLDTHNAERVFGDLRRVAGELSVAVVLVTHNEQAAAFSQRAYRLNEGRLARLAAGS